MEFAQTLDAVLARARPVIRRLPIAPPSLLMATALNRLLLPRLSRSDIAQIGERPVEIEVTDLGLRVRLRLTPQGFKPETGQTPAVRVAAAAAVFWKLARGDEDADRLFFERTLVMEGDTELGLVIKNTLDAVGPLWH